MTEVETIRTTMKCNMYKKQNPLLCESSKIFYRALYPTTIQNVTKTI
jgi:hypothetical protein